MTKPEGQLTPAELRFARGLIDEIKRWKQEKAQNQPKAGLE